MKLLIAMMLLVCGQTMAQRIKFDVPVNLTIKGADTVKTALYKLERISDTESNIQFEAMAIFESVAHNKYFVELPKSSFYLVLLTFPDNSHVELFIETSDKSIDPIDITVNKNSLVTRNVLYNKITGTYSWKEEPRSKVFFEGTKKLRW
jgi:hypothetical protein